MVVDDISKPTAKEGRILTKFNNENANKCVEFVISTVLNLVLKCNSNQVLGNINPLP